MPSSSTQNALCTVPAVRLLTRSNFGFLVDAFFQLVEIMLEQISAISKSWNLFRELDSYGFVRMLHRHINVNTHTRTPNSMQRLNQTAFYGFIDLICETCHCTHIWPCRDRLSVSIIEFHFPYTQRDTQNFDAFHRCCYSRRHSCFKQNALYLYFCSSHSQTYTQLWCMHLFSFFRESLLHYKKLIQDANSRVTVVVVVVIVVHCIQHKLNNAVHLERQRSEQTQNETLWKMYELPQSNKL